MTDQPDPGLPKTHRIFVDDTTILEMTVGEALDYFARFAEHGAAASPMFWSDSPDDLLSLDDGRVVEIYYTAAARQARGEGT